MISTRASISDFRRLLRSNAKRLVIAALLIIHVSWPLIAGVGGVGYDGAQYLKYAENLLSLHAYTFDGINPSCGRAPGYPIFLALFLGVFGNITLVYPTQLLLLFLAYLILYSMFKPVLTGWQGVGLIAFLTALWPVTLLGPVLQTEALFIFLTCASLLFLGRTLRRRRTFDLIMFAGLSTFSAYVRPVTMLFVFFAATVLFLTRRIGWRQALLMMILTAGILAPWTYRNWKVFDKFVPLAANYGSIYYMTDREAFSAIMTGGASTSHGLPVYKEIVGDDFELDLPANERYLARAKANIKRDPVGFFKRCLLKTVFIWSYLPKSRLLLSENLPLFFIGVLVQLTFLTSAAAGAWLLRRTHSWIVWPGVLFAIYHVFALFPFYAESRFLVPVYISLCGFSAYTFITLYAFLRRRLASTKRF